MTNAFRSIDGSNNNPLDPDLGQTHAQLLRKTPVDYGDGVSSLAGSTRLMAREVSNQIFEQVDSTPNSKGFSDFMWVWGQFLDHDITLTPGGANPVDKAPMPIPMLDPMFDPFGTGSSTMDFTRSTFDPTTGTDAGNPRQQVNVITPYVDASNIYGSDTIRAAAIRGDDGKMLTSAGDFLPFNTAGLPNAPSTSARLFLAGDERANENVALTSMHTVFVREHNRLVDELKVTNPGWTGEELYQQAKRIVEAEVQAITYNEFLPKLLGEDAIEDYSGYRSDVSPEIANVFSTAAFRLGHTMLSSKVHRLNEDGSESVHGNLELLNAFFRPDRLASEGGVEDVLRGAGFGTAEEVDTQIIGDVRNFLFGPPGAGGFDLAALNIQRGRDHGLSDYNTAREAYGLERVTSFAEITSDLTIQTRLEAVFGSVDDIDVFVGGLAEDAVEGSMLGELFQTVLVDQFTRIRDGDAFWYEGRLTADELAAINSTTLSDIIERNSDIETMQDDVFTSFTRVAGSIDNDVLFAGDKASMLLGMEGDDVLIGGTVSSEMHGGAGADSLYSKHSSDRMNGGDGNDQLHGCTGDDYLSGDKGNDFLIGNAGSDVFDGGEGDDYMVAGDGADRILFSKGRDVVEGFDVVQHVLDFSSFAGVSAKTDLTVQSFASGTLVADGADSSLWLAGVDDQAEIQFEFGAVKPEYTGGNQDRVVGSAGDDLFIDGAGTQYNIGGHGDDTIRFEGARSDFSVAKTIHGSGYVVWTDSSVDLMWDMEQIEFTDEVLELDLVT